jgi:LysR family glycine cleavage system transcriptional activator
MRKTHSRSEGDQGDTVYQKMPPLNAIRVFESAARNVSFTRAAEELFVTQGAISKQVKALEIHLGIPLFVRQHRKLLLTEEGEQYLLSIQAAFQTINSATQEIMLQPMRAQSIAVNVLPSLTISWLIPSLDGFKKLYPHLYVDLTIGESAIDFQQDKYDIAIRCCVIKPVGVNSIKLMDEDLCLVCSPEIAKRITTIDMLNEMTILEHTTRPELWQLWSKASDFELTAKQRFGMEHFYMLSQAAASSMGVALIPRFFVAEQLENGSLVIPFSNAYSSPYTYYLLTPNVEPLPLKVRVFIDWIYALFTPYR